MMGQRAVRQATSGPPSRQKSGQKSGEPEGSRQDSAGAGAGLDGAGNADQEDDPEATSVMGSVGDAIEEALGELSRVDTAASVWLPNRSANFVYYKVLVQGQESVCDVTCSLSLDLQVGLETKERQQYQAGLSEYATRPGNTCPPPWGNRLTLHDVVCLSRAATISISHDTVSQRRSPRMRPR